MNKLMTTIRDLHNDVSGAAMIEYTVLLGVILAVTIGVITVVGTKAGNVWSVLNTAMPNPTP